MTTRGTRYAVSWKGDAEKPGGIATTMGVHLFDVLLWPQLWSAVFAVFSAS